MDCGLYTQAENTINGRKIWFYLVTCPIGNICIVDYENRDDMAITRKIFNGDTDGEKAEKYFRKICSEKLKGKI